MTKPTRPFSPPENMIGAELKRFALSVALDAEALAQRMTIPVDQVRRVFRSKTPVPQTFVDFILAHRAQLGRDFNIILTGSEIRRMRYAIGWTLQEASDWAEVHYNTWRGYEQGLSVSQMPSDLAARFLALHESTTRPAPRATPEHIKTLRSHFHLTQQQLADRLRVTRVTLNRWENGVTAIPKNMLLTLRGLVAELKAEQAKRNEETQS